MTHVSRGPQVTCDRCGDVLPVVPDGRGFPPDIAKRKLIRKCRAKGCLGIPIYAAGLSLTVRPEALP